MIFGKKPKPDTINFVTETGSKHWCAFKNIPRKGEIINLTGRRFGYGDELVGEYEVLQVIYYSETEFDEGDNTIFIHIKRVADRKCITCKTTLQNYDSLTKCHNCTIKERELERASKKLMEAKAVIKKYEDNPNAQ